MMARLLRVLGALPARQLHLLGGGLLLILAASLWTFALRAPLAQLRTVRAEQLRLEAGGADPRLLAAQVAQADSAIAALSARMGTGTGTGKPAPDHLLVALVGAVNRLALAHGIGVTAVTPTQNVQTMVFDEVGFEAQVSGSYSALLAWMAAVEAAQPNIAIAGFEMQPAKTPGQILMTVRIAAYRPQASAP
jgi:Tfp pilus assembly protein PilO